MQSFHPLGDHLDLAHRELNLQHFDAAQDPHRRISSDRDLMWLLTKHSTFPMVADGGSGNTPALPDRDGFLDYCTHVNPYDVLAAVLSCPSEALDVWRCVDSRTVKIHGSHKLIGASEAELGVHPDPTKNVMTTLLKAFSERQAAFAGPRRVRELDPSRPDAATIRALDRTIRSAKCLIHSRTATSKGSAFMTWELGVAQGAGIPVVIFERGDLGHPREIEFLLVHPHMSEIAGYSGRRQFFVHDVASKRPTTLRQWLGHVPDL